MNARQVGFTLNELLVTLGVLGIGLSVAVPGLQSTLQEHRRTSALNNFVGAIHLARSEAVKRNEQVTVCPSQDGQSCDAERWGDGWLLFADADQDRQRTDGEPVVGALDGIPGVSIHSEEFENYFAYRPNGHVMVDDTINNVGQFTFCDARGPDFARVLVITVSGKPRLAQERLDGSAPNCKTR